MEINLIIEEITANNEVLHNEVATLKKRLRKKTQNEMSENQVDDLLEILKRNK